MEADEEIVREELNDSPVEGVDTSSKLLFVPGVLGSFAILSLNARANRVRRSSGGSCLKLCEIVAVTNSPTWLMALYMDWIPSTPCSSIPSAQSWLSWPWRVATHRANRASSWAVFAGAQSAVASGITVVDCPSRADGVLGDVAIVM